VLESIIGERLLASRVKELRVNRGWTQADLAREMTAAGCPIHQTAVSRIEKPSTTDGRRAIMLDEAIAFARVFEVPLGRLVSPAPDPNAVEDAIARIHALRQGTRELALERAVAEREEQDASATARIAAERRAAATHNYRAHTARIDEEFGVVAAIIREHPEIAESVRRLDPSTYESVARLETSHPSE
jgi:transcriptional regulator with XRE-family HTH domain